MIRDAILTHLRIKNLRQHVDTEITFDEGKQLLLFSGQNGHGKTTIFEAISYALYGQPRKTTPRTTLDSMVRWGEELEGLHVELAFTMGETNYVIKRRYVQGRSEATLSENGTVTTNSSGEVAKKVTLLFAMDAEGFRNAVVSEQQELAGLTSMDPTRRMKVISKITGITDMVNAAKSAKADVNSMKKVIREIGAAPDVPAAKEALAVERETFTALKETQEDLQKVVNDLAVELERSAHVDAEYRRRLQEKANAEGALSSAERNLSAARARLADLTAKVQSTEKPEVTTSTADLIPEKEKATAALNAAHEHNALVAKRAAIATNRETMKVRHTQLSDQVMTLRESMSTLTKDIATLPSESVEDVDSALIERSNIKYSASQTINEKNQFLSQLDSLPAVCPECQQEVSDEHKQNHRETAERDIIQAEKALEEADTRIAELTKVKADLATKTAKQREFDNASSELSRVKESLNSLSEELADSFEEMSALPEDERNTVALEQAVTDVTSRLQTALKEQEAVREYDKLLEAVNAANQQVDSATAEVDIAKQEVDTLVIPDSLIEQVEDWQQASKRFAAEKDLLHETSLDVVAAQGRINTAEQHLQRTESDEERRNQLLTSLEVSSATERLLDTAAKRAAAQLRPALEGSLSNLLSTMSGGLYSKAELSADYSVSVVKSGELRALNTFSGGEKDLIGLALRLALAQTVAARNSGTGPGFLILDEILGSQDRKRQATIFEALRSMKDLYPQVFIISHTSGSEDLADAVYETTASEEESGPLVATVVSYT